METATDGDSKKRFLKIYYSHHGNSYKPRPFIRLCGDYLFDFNFRIGDTVEVKIEKECITITKVTTK